MADGFVQVAVDGVDKKIDNSELTVGTNLVERQRVNIADPTVAANIATVSAAGAVGGFFAAVVGRQYLSRRKPYQAIWAVALAMFASAALFETAGQAFGWSDGSYKGYYLFGGQFVKSLIATLSFTGTGPTKTISKRMTSVLSFTGPTNLIKALSRQFSGVLSFIQGYSGAVAGSAIISMAIVTATYPSNLIKTVYRGFAASLSFVGSFSKIGQFRRSFNAVLSFVGTFITPQTPGVANINIEHDTMPNSIDIAVTETFPYKVDVSNYLVGTDTIGAIYATLIVVPTGESVITTWRNLITVSGNIVTIPILGSALRLGQRYQLTVTFVANTWKTVSFITYVQVVG